MTREELLKKALSLPELPGVYIMQDKKGEVIYVGKAKRLVRRVSSYFRPVEHLPKVEKMVENADDFRVIVVDSEFEALTLECSLIKQHRPRYNILMMDDKGFSYVRISRERYPRITAELQKNDDGADYIGPYISHFAVKSLVDAVNRVFRLPTCTYNIENGRMKRACLNAHIGLCCAPCVGKMSDADYRETVDNALFMITKGTDGVVDMLQASMEKAAEELEFEKAARLRDSIASIRKLEEGQKVIRDESARNMDVFAFAGNDRSVCVSVLKYRDGRLVDKEEQLFRDTTDVKESREEFVTHFYLEGAEIPREIMLDEALEYSEELERWLTDRRGSRVRISVPRRGEIKAIVNMAYSNAIERLNREAGRKNPEEAALGELAGLLGMTDYPERIELYDISNYGTHAAGGMAVYVGGAPKKSEYRTFRIKTVEGVDDYASMSEVLSRRVAEYDKGNGSFAARPDLILLDGGKGHLDVVSELLKDTSFADVPLFGLVKNASHRTRAVVGREGEISLSLHKRAYNLVSRMQDEVHRYTIGYERRSHSKAALKSALEEIPGIGEKRAKALMKACGSPEEIEKLGVDQLAAVDGMNARAAQAVWDHFHT